MSGKEEKHEWWLDLIMAIVCGTCVFFILQQHGFGEDLDANSHRTRNMVGIMKAMDKFIHYKWIATIFGFISVWLFGLAFYKFKKRNK